MRKISTLVISSLAAVCIMLLGVAARAQVINFDVPGGVSGNVNFSGQGALADLGNNYWNSVFTTTPFTTSGGLLSDGVTASPITLTATYGAGGGVIFTGDAQGANGTPAGLFAPFEDNKNSTFNTNTLNNVPPGTYNLYLYGDNGKASDSDRGTTFTVWTASTPASSLGTSNVQADANIFVQGVNYVEFTNLTLVSTGVINIAWTGNTTATNYHNPQTEGIFNGLQLQTIALLPGVSIHPTSLSPTLGSSTQLLATVFGATPFSYQWQKGTNGVFINSTDIGDVSGSKTNILSFNAVTISDGADYRLIVTNNYGSATSQVATVTVNLSPVISVQPASATLVVRGSLQLTPTVLGGLPLTYQWQKGTNGVFINSTDAGDVSGSTTNILSFSGASLSDAADYRLIVTNNYGSATSQVATVTIYPRFSSGPVGAVVPFTEYEGEAGTLGGGASIVSMIFPQTANDESVLEVSGGAYVTLTGTGQSVSWVNGSGQSITALNLRIQIPDAPTGGGTTNTLDLYVNGTFRQAITVNSTQVYIYGPQGTNDQSPADGMGRRVWDEFPLFITGSAIAPGSTIKLQKDSSNTASFYNIDVIDLETPPAPLSQPSNSISITSSPYNAVSNNPSVDNTSAIQSCINAASSQGKSVWIPAGTFYMGKSTTSGVQATNVTIQGAGEWYSTLYSNPNNPSSGGQMIGGIGARLQNFTLDANSTYKGCASATGMSGDNWAVDTVWVRHLSLAVWGGGSNGIIKNMRVNNTWSDGINLNNFSGNSKYGSNLTATNNFLRFTGDDSLAINGTDASGHTPMNGITIANNTIVQTAGRIVVYGGNNIVIKNNLAHDVIQNDGIQVGYHQQTANISNVLVLGNVLFRCGNAAFGGEAEMLIGTQSTTYDDNGTTRSYIDTGINVIGNVINDAYFGALEIQICTNVTIADNVIISPQLDGIHTVSFSTGNAVLDDNVVYGLGVGQPMFYNNSSGNYAVSSASGTMVRAPVEAASYNSLSSASAYREPCGEGGEDLTGIYNGDYAVYGNVNLTGINSFVARVASANAGGNMEIHLDSPSGTLVGTCAVTNTGGGQTWSTVTCNVSGASGYHDVYLVFTGGGGPLFNLEWFALLGNGNRMEAASCNSAPGLQTENCIEGGLDVTNISNGTYAVFNQVNLTGASSFNARVANAGSGGSIQIRLDSTNGTLIGTCTVSPTGGWQTWSTATCALNARRDRLS